MKKQVTFKPPPLIVSINYPGRLQEIHDKIISDFKTHQTSIPPTLYHYCGPDALLGIVSTQNMWFTHVDYFEDHAERRYGIKLVNENISDFLSRDLNNNQKIFLLRLREIYKKNEEYSLKDIFVACFCETADLLGQWERFANRSAGYSLGFRFTPSLCLGYGNDNYIPAWMLKVIYDPEEQNSIIRNSLELLCGCLATDPSVNPEDCTSVFINTVDSWLYGFKNSFFSEEREWRVLVNMSSMAYIDSPFDNVDFRNTGFSIVPYLKIRFLDETFENESRFPLQQIWMGPRTSETDKNAIRYLLLKNGFPEKVELRSSIVTLRK